MTELQKVAQRLTAARKKLLPVEEEERGLAETVLGTLEQALSAGKRVLEVVRGRGQLTVYPLNQREVISVVLGWSGRANLVTAPPPESRVLLVSAYPRVGQVAEHRLDAANPDFAQKLEEVLVGLGLLTPPAPPAPDAK